MRRVVSGIACAVALSGVLLGLVAAGNPGYTISTDDEISVPHRTYTFAGSQLEITHFTDVSLGQQITVTIDAPRFDSNYSLILYSKNENIVATDPLMGDATSQFPTDPPPPGTYILVVNGPDGNLRAAHPVVISSYDLTVSIPDQATVDSTVPIEVTVSPTVSDPDRISAVEVVVVAGDQSKRVTLSRADNKTYTGSVSISQVDTYRVYAVVRGTELIGDTNEKEALAVSSVSELHVTTPTPTATTSPTPTSSLASPTPSPTPTRSPRPTASPTTTSTAASEDNGQDGGTGPGGESSTQDDNTATPTSSPTSLPSSPPTETSAMTPTRTPTSSPAQTPRTSATTTISTPTDKSLTESSSETVTTISASQSESGSLTPSATPSPTNENVVTPNLSASPNTGPGTLTSTTGPIPLVNLLTACLLVLIASRIKKDSRAD